MCIHTLYTYIETNMEEIKPSFVMCVVLPLANDNLKK